MSIERKIETNIQLAVPIFFKDEVYVRAEIRKPTGKVIADTKKSSDTGDFFSSLRVFLVGCVESITKKDEQVITDKVALKSLIPKMPYKTAEQLALAIVSLHNSDDDGVEGVYYCPACNTPVFAKKECSDGVDIDTRDFISQLPIGYYEGTGIIEADLSEPVHIKNAVSGEILEEITSFAIGFPTLEHGINAFQKYGNSDTVRLQFSMFAQALVSVNGEPVDNRFKNAVGTLLFEGIKDVLEDLTKKIIRPINKCGVIPEIPKFCPNCGKEWKAQVNTSNFFASALRVS